jgi:hypothetical protein
VLILLILAAAPEWVGPCAAALDEVVAVESAELPELSRAQLETSSTPDGPPRLGRTLLRLRVTTDLLTRRPPVALWIEVAPRRVDLTEVARIEPEKWVEPFCSQHGEARCLERQTARWRARISWAAAPAYVDFAPLLDPWKRALGRCIGAAERFSPVAPPAGPPPRSVLECQRSLGASLETVTDNDDVVIDLLRFGEGMVGIRREQLAASTKEWSVITTTSDGDVTISADRDSRWGFARLRGRSGTLPRLQQRVDRCLAVERPR